MTKLPTIEMLHAGLVYRRNEYHDFTLKQSVINIVKKRRNVSDWSALNDVSIQVERGEVLAVVGRNGAGKSTLLKLLARVLPPTTGRVIVRGRVAPMIELGAGFNPELTVLENIVLYGTLLGRSRKDMRGSAPRIAALAGLSDFRDVAVRSLSSGMTARLAFAVASDSQPDVLLIDEVLSVGDAEFRERSSTRMKELIRSGASVVLVTHDLDVASELADRGAWLDRGNLVTHGEIHEVVRAYRQSLVND